MDGVVAAEVEAEEGGGGAGAAAGRVEEEVQGGAGVVAGGVERDLSCGRRGHRGQRGLGDELEGEVGERGRRAAVDFGGEEVQEFAAARAPLRGVGDAHAMAGHERVGEG